MKKSWHNPREVTVHQAPAEPGDLKRVQRLVALLAMGMERLLSTNTNETSTSLDFTPGISPNTTNVNDSVKMEN